MVATSGLVLALGATRAPVLDAAVVPLVAGFLLLLAVCRAVRPDDTFSAHRVLVLAGASFAAHFLIGIAINSSPTWVQYLGGDAVTYDQGARAIVAHWANAAAPFPYVGPGKEGFYYLLAGLYRVFGAFPVAGLAINAWFSASLVPLLYDITRRLFGAKAGWYAALIVMLQPGFLIWTSQLLREAGLIFFLAVALDCTIRLATRPSMGPALILAADVTLMLTFRADVGLMSAGTLAVGLVIGRRKISTSALSVGAVLLLVAVLVGAVGLGRNGYQATSQVNLSTVNAARSDLAGTAASGFDTTANVSTASGAIGYLPIGLPSFMFGPFPWQLHNIRQLLGGLEALTVLGLIPATWRGWRLARRSGRRLRFLLALPALGLALSLALLIGNYGTAVRERLQVTVFLIPLAAAGLSEGRARRKVKASGDTAGDAPDLGIDLQRADFTGFAIEVSQHSTSRTNSPGTN